MTSKAVSLLGLAVLCLCQGVLTQNSRLDYLRDRIQTTTTPKPANGRIIGGQAIADNCMAPFNSMVALQIDADSATKKLTYCTGTLISPDIVVTAAICLLPFVNFPTSAVKVIAGDRELLYPDTDEQVLNVQQFVIHPNFNIDTGANNVAVVKLSTPAVLGRCVQVMERYTGPVAGTCNSALMSCKIAGWGSYSVVTAVNNSQPARYGDVRVFDDIMTQLVYTNKYKNAIAASIGSFQLPDLPPKSIIAEAFENSNIATCIYDWGSMVACNMGGSYKLRGVVSNANCDIAALYGAPQAAVPIFVTKVDSFQSWLNVCITNFASCATST